MGIFVLYPNKEKEEISHEQKHVSTSMHAGIAQQWRQISFGAMLVHKKEVFSL